MFGPLAHCHFSSSTPASGSSERHGLKASADLRLRLAQRHLRAGLVHVGHSDLHVLRALRTPRRPSPSPCKRCPHVPQSPTSDLVVGSESLKREHASHRRSMKSPASFPAKGPFTIASPSWSVALKVATGSVPFSGIVYTVSGGEHEGRRQHQDRHGRSQDENGPRG